MFLNFAWLTERSYIIFLQQASALPTELRCALSYAVPYEIRGILRATLYPMRYAVPYKLRCTLRLRCTLVVTLYLKSYAVPYEAVPSSNVVP
jgi:hypothetical protein